jgi:hypothetical protein
MNRLTLSSLGLVAALAAAPALEAQYPIGSNAAAGISVWKDKNYSGASATFREDVPDLSRFRFQNSISSFRVASGETWEACDQPYYRGRCQVLSAADANLDNDNWNDRIESLRRVTRGESRGDVYNRGDRNDRGGRYDRRDRGDRDDRDDRGYGRGSNRGRDMSLNDAARVCTDEAQRRGLSVASTSTPSRNGTVVVMDMQVRRNSRGRTTTASCTYDIRNGSAQLRY